MMVDLNPLKYMYSWPIFDDPLEIEETIQKAEAFLDRPNIIKTIQRRPQRRGDGVGFLVCLRNLQYGINALAKQWQEIEDDPLELKLLSLQLLKDRISKLVNTINFAYFGIETENEND